MDLPADYLEYWKFGKPTSGYTDLELGGYFDLEPIKSIQQLNIDLEIAEHAPGFLAFASCVGPVHTGRFVC